MLGSNIFDNMKHWVAIGGAFEVGAGTCGCGGDIIGPCTIPETAAEAAAAAAAAAACCCWTAGNCPIWFMARDLAAYSGIWNPVPEMIGDAPAKFTMLWANSAYDKLVIFFLENRIWHFMQIVS